MKIEIETRQLQRGFTLVELAIVLVIIGLLIGGILKGQQLVTNARVTSQIAQIQAIDAATTSFKDTYGSLPGDLATPAARLASCSGLCAETTGTAGDGIIGAAAAEYALQTAVPSTADVEVEAYFPQLAAAGLLNSVSSTATAATLAGAGVPASKSGGEVTAGTSKTDGYLYLANTLNGTIPAASGAGVMTPAIAMGLDLKMDDGNPSTGTVYAVGGTGAAGACYTGTLAAPGTYTGTTTSKDCGQEYRIQG